MAEIDEQIDEQLRHIEEHLAYISSSCMILCNQAAERIPAIEAMPISHRLRNEMGNMTALEINIGSFEHRIKSLRLALEFELK